jgi:hypothetical protein
LALVDFSQSGHVNKNADYIGAGTSYIIPPTTGSAVSIPNASFAQPVDTSGHIPGWALVAGGANAAWYLNTIHGGNAELRSYAGAAAAAICAKRFSVNPGDSVWLGVYMSSPSGTYTYVQVAWFNAAGIAVGSPIQPATTSGTMALVSSSGAAPSGAAYFELIFAVSDPGSGYGYGDIRNIECRVNDVRVAGSGARIGDQRNLLQRTVTNIPSKVGSTISYSASAGTPATATISVGSFTVLAGSVSVSYSASSASVTGTNGTASSYYLYMNDPSYAGGTQTLVATTTQNDLYSGDGYVYVGYVTVNYPSSGTGSGGGTGCPDENAWVLRADPEGVFLDAPMQAMAVREGHYLRLSDGRMGLVTYSKRKAASRVRVIDENGKSLTCSTSAPLELFGAQVECVVAPESAGCCIAARTDGAAFGALVWRVEDVGDGYVQHITCENACFWTGDDPDHLFSHHNLKPP